MTRPGRPFLVLLRILLHHALLFLVVFCTPSFAQETIIVRPVEMDDVLVNPGIGFMTFQRFNGDSLNEGKKWTEGHPIIKQDFDGNLENENHPMTSLAYFRMIPGWFLITPKLSRREFSAKK